MGALILAGLVQGAQDVQDVFGPRGGQHSGLQYWLVLVSIDQYSSVVVSSFRIARNGRGRRKFSGYGAILTATTEPWMQACYSLSNDVVQRV